MSEQLLRLYVWQVYRWDDARRDRRPFPARNEAGEGVISMAIAVLIMAFLGVIVWVGFRATLDNTQKKVDGQVDQIGR